MKKNKTLNPFIIYRTVVHNYLKAKNIKYSGSTVSKIASKLWKNEYVDVKNAYKQLAETKKHHKKNFEVERINSVEKPTSFGTTTTNDIPSVNTELILYFQSPAFPLNPNSPQIINDTAITSMQTLNFQYNLTIVSLNIEPINVKPFLYKNSNNY
ncbi:12978_t:CDS:1 [Cetraspora pellucida]|uniref:12978_t:CDS:1 n=1 Tax=Cetraspora pellucida TaxID=1433469 RepID=A0A9N9BEF0_9GLOM|nr:12978_t:CDS:1 [Cetraspora pellucida]